MLNRAVFVGVILFSILGAGIATENTGEDYLCEEQLLKYKNFVLEIILNLENICEIFIAGNKWDQDYVRIYGQKDRFSPWTLLRFVFMQGDNSFSDFLKDAIVERCHSKTISEKRDGVVLGKKQRFHSWGGKRSLRLQTHPERNSPEMASIPTWN